MAPLDITMQTRCLGELRWMDISGPNVVGHELQQAWEITQYRFGMQWKQYVEWRKVPFVTPQ